MARGELLPAPRILSASSSCGRADAVRRAQSIGERTGRIRQRLNQQQACGKDVLLETGNGGACALRALAERVTQQRRARRRRRLPVTQRGKAGRFDEERRGEIAVGDRAAFVSVAGETGDLRRQIGRGGRRCGGAAEHERDGGERRPAPRRSRTSRRLGACGEFRHEHRHWLIDEGVPFALGEDDRAAADRFEPLVEARHHRVRSAATNSGRRARARQGWRRASHSGVQANPPEWKSGRLHGRSWQ